MKVLLFSGDLKTVTKSGVGEAMRHQKQILTQLGIPFTQRARDDFDVVHVNTVFLPSFFMSVWARLRRKKVIYYAHSTKEDFVHSFKTTDFFAPLFKWWIKRCYNTASVLITPTEYSKNLLSTYGLKRPIYALSNGIDSDFFAPSAEAGKRFREKYGIPEEKKVAISVGHYIERKGILDFAAMAKDMPDVEFYWFGYSNLNLIPAAVRQVIENPPANLHFPGYVGREDLRDAYCGSDVFLFLTHEETEGIVLLEALSTEIPVIVRDIPIYETFLTHGKDVYKGKSCEDFEALLSGVLSGELPDVGENGRKTACTRDLHAVGEGLCKIYQTMFPEFQAESKKNTNLV